MKKILLLITAIIFIAVLTCSQTSFGQEQPMAQHNYEDMGLKKKSENLNNIAPVNGTDISIKYDITNGKLLSINADAQSESLIILIQSTDAGNFTINIPRSLLDARENGQSTHFIVLMNNHGIRHQEVDTDMNRALEIPLHQGMEKIQIIGTGPYTQGLSSQGFNSSSNQEVIEAPFSNNPPIIDGKWNNPNEWNETDAVTVEGNGTKMYILAQHDMNFLYIMDDIVTDQITPSYSPVLCDSLLMNFDTNNSHGLTRGNNTIGVGTNHTFLNGTETKTAFGSEVWTYDNQSNSVDLASPSGYNSSMGFSSTNDPFDSTHDHRIYEFRIPLSLLHNSDKYGFSLNAAASSGQNTTMCMPIYSLFWPSGTTMSAPSSYGILELDNATTTTSSSETISNNSELIIVGIIVGAGGGIAGFFYYKISKQKMKR